MEPIDLVTAVVIGVFFGNLLFAWIAWGARRSLKDERDNPGLLAGKEFHSWPVLLAFIGPLAIVLWLLWSIGIW